MKIVLSFVLLALCAVVVRPAPDGSQAPSFVLPIVKRDSLLNGLQTVILAQPGTGSVSVRVRVNSGAMFDLAGKGGLADLTAAMLLRGGGGLSAQNIRDTVEQLGLTVKLDVGWDATDLEVSGPADTLDDIFDLLNRMLVAPEFAAADFEALKKERIAALESRQLDAAEEVRARALETAYGQHPFGRPPGGTAETLARIDRNDVRFFYDRYYLANNAVLLVSGDATQDNVTRLARGKLGAWRKGNRVPATFRPPEPATGRRVVLLDKPAEPAQACVAQVAVSRRAPDYFAAMIAAELLGQTTSKLAASWPGAVFEVRVEPRYLPGPMLISISAPADKLGGATEAVVAELVRLQAGHPTLEQLEWAKSRLLARFAERMNSKDGTAAAILDVELYGLGRDYLVSYVDRVNAVTAAEVQRAAQTYFNSSNLVIAAAGPAATLQPQLQKIGPVTLVKPAGGGH